MTTYSKSLFCLLVFTFLTTAYASAQVGINSDISDPDPSAMLDISSSDKGILIPRMDSTNRKAISNPATGLMVYDSTTHSFWYHANATWNNLNRTFLADTDGDTKIQVEESDDDDIIRFDLGGTEYMRLDSGRIEILNTGGSVFIGEGAGANDDYTDNQNVFIGDSSGYSNITGWNNIFQGYQSGYFNIGGNNNVFQGYESGYFNTSGHSNIFQGSRSGYHNTSGYSNVFQGFYSGSNNTYGNSNVFQGSLSGFNNTLGSSNIFLGHHTGFFNETGNNNVFLGYQSGYRTTGSQNVFLGFRAGYNETGSNKLYIDNSDTSTPLIYGDFDSDSLQINGTLNINGVYEFPIVDGTANQVLATDGSGTLSWTGNTDIQTVSLSNDTLTISNGNSIALNSAFISEDGVTHSTYNSDDFVVGADSLNYSGSGEDYKMFFEQSIGAFRVGRIKNTNWDDTNLGGYSFATGTSTMAFGYNSAAFGFETIALGTNSFAGGNKSEAIGNISFAFGREVTAPSYCEIAIGLFNTTYTPDDSTNFDADDRLFVVGNGTGIFNRSDAMIVYKNGNTEINGALTIKGNYTFPTTDGAVSQVLATDGSGTLSWTDQNSIDLTGNIAIGTSSAGSESDFQDGSDATNDGFLTTPWIYTNAIEATGERSTGSTAITVGDDGKFGNGDEIHLVTNGISALTVDGNSCVGIGTTTPSNGLLEVSGSANAFPYTYYYYNYNDSGSGGIANNAPSYSIYADGKIAGTNFHAHSDKRIKQIQGVSNAKEDLKTLMNIEITNYRLIDKIAHGDVPVKKVIAQQVKEVYPQAVTSNTIEIVPDIYQTASIDENGWIKFSNSEFQLSNTKLKVGEKVQILVKNKKEVVEVVEIKANTFRVQIRNFNVPINEDRTVFVYGRQVDDFHTVDYEAISMLNVSATQQLVKEIEQLTIKNKEQQKEIKQLEAQVSKIQQLEQQINKINALEAKLEAFLQNQP